MHCLNSQIIFFRNKQSFDPTESSAGKWLRPIWWDLSIGQMISCLPVWPMTAVLAMTDRSDYPSECSKKSTNLYQFLPPFQIRTQAHYYYQRPSRLCSQVCGGGACWGHMVGQLILWLIHRCILSICLKKSQKGCFFFFFLNLFLIIYLSWPWPVGGMCTQLLS